MGRISLGINLEFVRREDKPFEWGVMKAAELGYDYVRMRYVLQEAAKVAEPRGVLIGLEPHQQHSKTPAGLRRIGDLVESAAIGVNFDTGNSYLAGEDPLAWLPLVLDRLVHVHAKEISLRS